MGSKKSASVTSAEPYQVQWQRQADPKWFPAVLYIYIIAAIVYFIWRTSVVNWDIWYGPVVYLAELYGLFATTLFLFVTQKMFLPVHHPITKGRTVDVMIPTYNEPLSVLEPVVIGALEIRGVRKVLVLDDGNRREVKAMAKRLGAKYYPRKTNEHAKAGNLNNGLRFTNAEFLVLLDADHIPLPSFIERTLGFFEDEQLGFVQTPQTFYNTSSFLFRRRGGRPAAWSEQQMFYDCIQPAKNRWNAAFFVGTSAMLRRSALDSVGGFATGTATEDIHTSLRLHARKWKSVFLPEALAYGLEAENLKEFYKQRKRWAAGSLGLLFRSPDSPLRARGLSLAQRLNYISATIAHLQGVQKYFFFLTPIVAIFSQVSPVQGSSAIFIIDFTLFFIIALTSTWIYSRGTYHIIYTEAYSLANMLAHFGGIKGVLKVQKKFAVSKKTARRRERTWLTLILWSMYWMAAAAIVQAGISYFVYDTRNTLLAISMIFISINVGILLSFLLYLRNYERKGVLLNSYHNLKPREMYRHISTRQHIVSAPDEVPQPQPLYELKPAQVD